MTTTEQIDPYHHGDLSNALLETAVGLARTGGPDAITIRAVTRKVGVSPSAAYRHYADLAALTMAAARRANVLLARSMIRATDELGGTSAHEIALNRLRGVGLGYIRFSLEEPGWAALAFAAQGQAAPPTPPVTPTVGVDDETPSPFVLLTSALDAMVDAGLLSPHHREHAEWPCWATVHGFGELVSRGPLTHLPAATVHRLASRCVDTIIAGLDADPPRLAG